MGNIIDLTGQTFGKLTVIKKDESKSGRWLCKCSCGNPELKSIAGQSLKKNKLPSCRRCLQYEMIGQKYGHLTVLEVDLEYQKEHNIKKFKPFLKCQCDCEDKTIITVNGYSLRSGNTISCGCVNKKKIEKYNIDQTNKTLIPNGTRFGKLTTIKPIGYYPQYEGSKKNRMWYQCKCDCGEECIASGNILKQGQKQSCGCLKSKGELEINQLLKANKNIYQSEIVLQELYQETNRKLRFDFIVYNEDMSIKRIIEFDGRQHYSGPDSEHWGHSLDTLETIKERDNIKNNFCLKHNYDLVRIPYTKIGKITLDDLFGDKYLIKRGELL